MANNSNGKSLSASSEEINEIRTKFKIQHSDDISSKTYDEQDINRLLTNDNYTRLFMRRTYKSTDILALMHNSLKWRHDIGVSEWTPATIPDLLWDMNGMFYHNKDKNGNKILYIEVKKYRKDLNILSESKNFFAYLLETCFRENCQQKVAIVFDMSNTGLNNYDLDLIRFIIACFKTYYPGILAYLLVFDMPWLFTAIWRIVKAWLREEEVSFIKFVNQSSIQEYIEAKYLFPHMGGTFIHESPKEEVDELASKAENGNQKKVTFSEVEENYAKSEDDDSLDNTYERVAVPLTQENSVLSDENDNIAYDSHKTEDDIKYSPEVNPQENFVIVANILSISPPYELEFVNYDMKMTSGITLKVCGEDSAAFKIKTTSPQKYRVKPSSGVVVAGSPVNINIVLLPNFRGDVDRDKFLLMVTKVPNSNSSELPMIWKTTEKSLVYEHRLCCSFARDPPSDISPTTPLNDWPSSNADVGELKQQICILSNKHEEMSKKISFLTILHFISLCLLTLIILLYVKDRLVWSSGHCPYGPR